jgi:uncharacterized membrane protein
VTVGVTIAPVDPSLAHRARRFMSPIVTHVRTRPRLFISLGVGVLVALCLFTVSSVTVRALIGWNVSVWLFLVLVSVMMMRADHDHVRRNAIEQSEGAAVVLTLVVLAAAVSIFAIVAELASAKAPGAHLEIQHVLFALVTVTGAWLLLPTLFAMNYASLFYQSDRGTGLLFPSLDKTFKPDYADFMYFSFTIAVASQTADVDITTRSMRRLVLLHSVLSFVFNTTILAFTINIAASLF